MTRKHKIFICACKENPVMRFYGIGIETPDYKLAYLLREKIENDETNAVLKDSLEPLTEQDIIDLTESRILIVICTMQDYLEKSKPLINEFIKNANIGDSIKVKRIVYVSIESCGTMTKGDFLLKSSGNYVVDSFELNPENMDELVEDTHKYFLKLNFNKKTASVRQSLKEYRSILADSPTDHPIERKWLDKLIDKWIECPKDKKILWIQGEHGSGKTIYIGDYYQRLKGVLGKGIYYCKSSNSQTLDCERIVKAIAYDLCEAIPEYATQIEDYVTGDKFLKHSAQQLFIELIINPFANIAINNKDKNFYFIIDAIDELKTNKINVLDDFLNLLFCNIDHLPSFFYFIVTSPINMEIFDIMQLMNHREISLFNSKYKENVKDDARRYIESQLTSLGISYKDDQINIILEKSENNFDYLHYFLKQCSEMGQLVNDLDQLPRGLKQQFTYDFRNRFEANYYKSSIRPILQVLSDAYVPLTVNDLSQILQIEVSDINTIVKGQLAQFLRFEKNEENLEIISLNNCSLEMWLNDLSHGFCLTENNNAKEICEWMKRKGHLFYNNDYLRKYGLLHLWESHETDYILKTLIIGSDNNLYEKISEGLAALYITLLRRDDSSAPNLIEFYSENYSLTYRIRNILVYSYRYVLGNIGIPEKGLNDLTDVLINNYEEVRAKLLIGESIEDYEEAKTSFKKTIKYAESLANRDNDDHHSKWWSYRMLGVAYNRLAHLEAHNGNIDDALVQYKEGDKCFDTALEIIQKTSSDPIFMQKTEQDRKTLLRDKAIINERMGDLNCSKRDYQTGKKYYEAYYDFCKKASETNEIKALWDLSTSLLRLGDSCRYLGYVKDAYLKYKEALTKRKIILQNLRNDIYEKIFTVKHRAFINFDCPDCIDVPEDFEVDEVPKESRDIDPIRDIAMCYVRLGDLAYSLSLTEVAKQYYEIWYIFCDISLSESKSKLTESDMQLCKERQMKLVKC